ncbi:MAG: 4-hydroxy-3-methylbut-2-enyl diphosphate reductase [Alphaproteobacteria bacterium]|jgi:4-hydroxy-3-methylbut-2-en-1-yl diphosphate reductase|nr:4-hydroxy-3-methylbut-2-enyl diphosphate reductase [Rhodospirillaceae bacterium]MDG2479368.1 4-hydroxy-3-methylbut-2-enyl diphosphate reductase [Alphaproteobacteria bacterium]MBT6204852.1 4-hydroxy-3-methylbut-2-enyl diphosphate reductase [Rhodospirillaceae bacterium]MBT6509560.1 4-hydroxy-3-methylbut-2-enyl diphosphate reductase [Rhodospirillaceae bacterium]MBT7611621.1 4-hydroxy-3-methylbut-2-enyl diphosphate reductase [Rhodospirillaceae bacterium]
MSLPGQQPPMHVLLASPRGFCAGVDRAIQIVEQAIEQHGAPVYVRHEIVHNRFVVEALEAKGAIFVEELDEIPHDDRPVVFSAHGVPKSVPADAKQRKLFYLDATCPLVSKVHHEAEKHHGVGRNIILIGHAGHPEVVGTMGQLPDGAIVLVQSVADAEAVEPENPEALAYITQTTLSVDDTSAIVDVLRRRFPAVHGPHRQDICYATTNRQEAVKAMARRCDLMLVIGASNSSNSVRLVEVAKASGSGDAVLIARASELGAMDLSGIATLGITAGASAPELLVEEVIAVLREDHDLTIEEVEVTREDVHFKLPRALAG